MGRNNIPCDSYSRRSFVNVGVNHLVPDFLIS